MALVKVCRQVGSYISSVVTGTPQACAFISAETSTLSNQNGLLPKENAYDTESHLVVQPEQARNPV